MSATAAAETRPRYGGEIIAPLLSEPAPLDPIAATTHADHAVIDLVCDTLYQLDAGGTPRPRLAVALPEHTADGKAGRIRLRAGVAFHGGAELSAGDVARSLERARTGAASSWALAPVERVSVDGADVVVHLRRATPELASLLAMTQTAIALGVPEADRLVGTGAYAIRLVDRKRRRIVLDAHERHFAGRAYADVVELRWYDTADAETKDYEAGRTHVSFRGAVAFAGHRPRYATDQVTGPATVLAYLGFGGRHADITGNKNFRRALSLALDRDSFRAVGTGEPVAAAVAPAAAALGGPSPGAAEIAARTSEARRALTAAAREVDSLRDGAPTLEIAHDPSRPDDEDIARKVQAALFRLDLKARLVAVERAELARRLAAADIDLYIGQLAAPAADPALEVAAAFAAGGNGWAARALARAAPDLDAMLAEFADQLPVVPLTHRAIRAHHRSTLGGVAFDGLGRLPLGDVHDFAER